MALIAFLHLCIVSMMVGTNIYTSFVSGPVSFMNLPRHIFGNLQSKLFPWYFRTFVVGSAIGLYSLRELFSEDIKPIANAESFLSFDISNPFLIQIYILFTSLVVSIMNMVWIGPWATRVMFAVHKIEKSEDKAQDKQLLANDDPFARKHYDSDSQDDDDSDGNDDEDTGSKNRMSKKSNGKAIEGSEDEESEDFDSDHHIDDEDDESGLDDDSEGSENLGDEDEDDISGEEELSEDDTADMTSKLQTLMNDTKTVTSTIAAGRKADENKGAAIKAQRKTFDSLLNTRVKLQKGIVATNSIAINSRSDATTDDALAAAEAACLALLSTLTNLRTTLDSSRTGQKRKRVNFESSTPTSEIRSRLKQEDESTASHRDAVLQKWYTKTRNAKVHSQKSRLQGGAQQTLPDVLATQLRDPARLVERTRINRQAGSTEPSAQVYDDSDWYSLLLKDLLENRSLDLKGSAEFVIRQPWEMVRQAKTKKIVDTKASKGRRLRYTVHEKLQNFMAPEERGNWGERQREELFAGLFGRRAGLGEDESDRSDEEMNAEEEGLMLFRS